MSNSGILQLFYMNRDFTLRSFWRYPDGTWSGVQDLGGQFGGDIRGGLIAAQVPGTDVLQLFYRGMDFGVTTFWRNPDGSWSGEQNLGGGLNAGPIAAQVPGTDILQLFYLGADNGVWTRLRNPDGTWSDEQNLGGSLSSHLCAAQVPGTDVLQLFYAGTDRGVWTRWRNPDGSWSDEQNIGGSISDLAPFTSVLTAAQVPGTDVLQLFYVKSSQQTAHLASIWRNPDGSWSDEQNLGAQDIGGSIAAAQLPGTDILQLFYISQDQGIRTIWRNPDGSWSNEQNLGNAPVALGIAVAVIPS